MTRFVIPSLRYNYVHVDTSGTPVLPGAFRPDEIEYDTQWTATAAVGVDVEALFVLTTRSCSLSNPTLGTTGLSHVHVFATVPRCDMGQMDVKPREFGLTSEVIDQTALFRQPRARVGTTYSFSVMLTPTASGILRIAFGLRAAELNGVVLMRHDLVVP